MLLPIGLAALAAVIVPLVIHIARRSEVRPTDFAALRWLRPKPKPRNQLRFDEWPLLILRLILLSLIAVWLARPVLIGAADRSAYVAVVPGALIDGVEGVDPAKAHWLAPGFPLVKTPKPGGGVPVASLIRQLDAELPAGTALSIVTPSVIEGADAQLPRLTRRVDWRVVAGSMPPRVAGPARSSPPVSIRHDAGHAGGVRYLRAAVQAWAVPGQASDLDVADLSAAVPAPGRVWIWLGGGTLPLPLTRSVTAGGTGLVAADAAFPGEPERAVLWRDGLGRPLIEAIPLGQGRLLRFTRPLTAAEMPELLEADFPARLSAVLEDQASAPARVSAGDYAPVIGAPTMGGSFVRAPTDVRPWLAALIALVLLGERWLATSRRRGVWP
ncbi:BatA domain-containing protein [soil metagenome]